MVQPAISGIQDCAIGCTVRGTLHSAAQGLVSTLSFQHQSDVATHTACRNQQWLKLDIRQLHDTHWNVCCGRLTEREQLGLSQDSLFTFYHRPVSNLSGLMMIGCSANQNHGLQHAGWLRGSPYTTRTGCRMDQRYWHDGTHLWTALDSLG